MDPNVPKVKAISNTDSGTRNPHNKHKKQIQYYANHFESGKFWEYCQLGPSLYWECYPGFISNKIPTLTGLYTILEQ